MPRRPTPSIRAPTIRRRVAEGVHVSADASIGGGAENAAPSGAENKIRVARVRPGSSVGEGAGAFGVPAAGVAGGAPFGGANSLLGKSRGAFGGPLGGRNNSPLMGSPLRAASPLRTEGGSAPFSVPTPPRDDTARPGSAARRAPIRPAPMPRVPPAE